MSKLHLTTALLLVAVQIGSGAAPAETPRHPDELTLPDLTFAMPAATETRLSNGIRVLLFENHDLPLINFSAYLAMGDRYLPPERLTVSNILDWVWDQGGIGALSPEEVDAQVAALGMSLSSGVGWGWSFVQASMVREDLAAGASLWGDLLLRPRFDVERLERAKARQLKDIQGINDNPERLAETWFLRLLSGENSPEGFVDTREGIESVTREELQALYDQFVRPERVVIGVSGDISMEEAVPLLESLLADWQGKGETPSLEPYVWQRTPKPGVYLLPGDFEQCTLRMGRGHPGLTDNSDQYPEVRLLDFGFGYRRVFYRTRSEGLSYGTATRLTADESRGKFWAFGSTRPGSLLDLITVVREEVGLLSSSPMNEDEVDASLIFSLGRQIQKMETARDVVGVRLEEIVMGRPDGYIANQVTGLQAATVESVAKVAASYINFGDSPVVLVVGTPEGGVEALENLGLGPVTVLEPMEFGK